MLSELCKKIAVELGVALLVGFIAPTCVPGMPLDCLHDSNLLTHVTVVFVVLLLLFLSKKRSRSALVATCSKSVGSGRGWQRGGAGAGVQGHHARRASIGVAVVVGSWSSTGMESGNRASKSISTLTRCRIRMKTGIAH